MCPFFMNPSRSSFYKLNQIFIIISYHGQLIKNLNQNEQPHIYLCKFNSITYLILSDIVLYYLILNFYLILSSYLILSYLISSYHLKWGTNKLLYSAILSNLLNFVVISCSMVATFTNTTDSIITFSQRNRINSTKVKYNC